MFYREKWGEFFRFAVVGIVCTLIDASVFYAIHHAVGYRLAMISGFCVSLSINYLLNIYWSFRSKPSFVNAVGIIAAHCLNIFVVRMMLMWCFINIVHLPEEIAYIPTLVISIVTNFLIIRLICRIA